MGNRQRRPDVCSSRFWYQRFLWREKVLPLKVRSVGLYDQRCSNTFVSIKMKTSMLFTLWTTDCTTFFSSETCCCECQWTEAEQSRMQLITKHSDASGAAFSIITSNCHLLIHIGFVSAVTYVLLICNFFALLKFQSFKNSSFCLFGCWHE